MGDSAKGYDEFRRRLDKLMSNPEKPVVIPELRELKAPRIRDFNREVSGSVAGAGSGDFHTYRALRRKEAARQNYVLTTARIEDERERFEREVAEARAREESKLSKNRLKRLKQKQRSQLKKEASQSPSPSPGGDEENPFAPRTDNPFAPAQERDADESDKNQQEHTHQQADKDSTSAKPDQRT